MACEDYPCCGHEWGDCEGQLYGSDEAIKQRVFDEMDAEMGFDDVEHDTEEDCLRDSCFSLPTKTNVWECDICGREFPQGHPERIVEVAG